MEQASSRPSSGEARARSGEPGEDTTVEKEATEQLQQALLLIEHAFAAVALLDEQGRLVWANEGFSALLSRAPGELLGHSLWSILPPESGETPASHNFLAGLSASSSYQYEGQIPNPQGTAQWVRVKVQPATAQPSHEPARFIVLLDDITSQKATQAPTPVRETQLHQLLEQVPGVLFQWRDNYDGTSRLTYFGDNAQEVFGFEVTQQTQLRELVHPDDQKAWAAFWRPAHGAAKARTFQGRLLVPGHPLRWYQADCQLSATDAEGVLYSGILQDITALQEAEEALQDSEQRWLLAIERFGDGAWEFNYQTGDDYFSNAYRAMIGYPDEDLPTGFQTWQDHVHPDDLALSLQAAEAYLRGESPIYTLERRLLCRDGGQKWVLTRGLVTKRDANGEPLIMTGVHTDITAIKQANLAIEASTRRLSTTIANFQEGILLEDEHRQVVLANEAFCCMLNTQVRPEQLQGVKTEELLAASGMPVEQGWLLGAESLVRKQQAVIGELLPRKNGQVFRRDFIPIYSHDASLGYLWKFQDVTEQKNAEDALRRREEKYRRIIERMNLGLVETNLDDQVLYVNQAFCDMLGFSSAEIIEQDLLRPLLQEVSPLDQEGLEAYERMVLSKAGSPKWLLISRASVYDDDRQIIGCIRITLDITHQKTLENKLRAAKEHAEYSSKAKQDFLANMSHEIRTPMNAILGMAQLLSKTPLTLDQDDYLQAITTSGENLLVIINDILDHSKIEAGQLQMERIGFSASQLIAQIETTLHYKAEEKGLLLVVEVAPELPAVLLGDPYRITQVLLNLAGNAIKFTEKGQVTISCQVVQYANDAVEVLFRVTDTGIGIDPAYLRHIFKEFSQEDSSVTRQFGGTGLGLSISKSLVNLMGGELHIESEKYEGTLSAFSLLLPVGAEDDMPRKELVDSSLRKKIRGKKVLLVEDNRFNRQIAKAFLTNAHLQVTEAENGALAVELLQTQRFDLILMDMQMPVMNGLEATAVVRQQLGLVTPIIALTANAIKGEREKCLEAGMDDYLAKPFQEDELLKLISDWVLERARTERPAPTAAAAAPVNFSLPAPLYKLDLLYQIGQCDDDFVALMLESFIESCEEAIHDLNQVLHTQDIKLMRAATHKLKPSLDHLHVHQALPMVEQLDSWTAAFDSELLPPLIQTVNGLLAQIVRLMHLDLENLATKKTP